MVWVLQQKKNGRLYWDLGEKLYMSCIGTLAILPALVYVPLGAAIQRKHIYMDHLEIIEGRETRITRKYNLQGKSCFI